MARPSKKMAKLAADYWRNGTTDERRMGGEIERMRQNKPARKKTARKKATRHKGGRR